MPNIPASLQAPPGQGGPQGSAPLPNPGGSPGQPKPPGQGGGMNPIQLLLSFLAGAGLDKVVAALSKITQQPGTKGAPKPHGATQAQAAQNPAMSVPPQMAQQMAQGMGGGGADEALNSQMLPMLLALLASKGGSGGTPPGSMGGMQ